MNVHGCWGIRIDPLGRLQRLIAKHFGPASAYGWVAILNIAEAIEEYAKEFEEECPSG